MSSFKVGDRVALVHAGASAWGRGQQTGTVDSVWPDGKVSMDLGRGDIILVNASELQLVNESRRPLKTRSGVDRLIQRVAEGADPHKLLGEVYHHPDFQKQKGPPVGLKWTRKAESWDEVAPFPAHLLLQASLWLLSLPGGAEGAVLWYGDKDEGPLGDLGDHLPGGYPGDQYLIISPDDDPREFLVDTQGHDYPRYMLRLPHNWRDAVSSARNADREFHVNPSMGESRSNLASQVLSGLPPAAASVLKRVSPDGQQEIRDEIQELSNGEPMLDDMFHMILAPEGLSGEEVDTLAEAIRSRLLAAGISSQYGESRRPFGESSIPPAKGLEYMSPDTVAETLDGVSEETSSRLWQLLSSVRSQMDPETQEWPEPIESDQSVVAIWDQLTPEQQSEINAAFAASEAEFDSAYDRASARAEFGADYELEPWTSGLNEARGFDAANDAGSGGCPECGKNVTARYISAGRVQGSCGHVFSRRQWDTSGPSSPVEPRGMNWRDDRGDWL